MPRLAFVAARRRVIHKQGDRPTTEKEAMPRHGPAALMRCVIEQQQQNKPQRESLNDAQRRAKLACFAAAQHHGRRAWLLLFLLPTLTWGLSVEAVTLAVGAQRFLWVHKENQKK